MKSEQDLIRWLTKTFSKLPRGMIGIGDDAAVIPAGGGKDLVLTTDVIVQNIDFLMALPPEKIGRKAIAVNLSDLAAMGAQPACFLVSLGVPVHLKETWIHRCYQGMMKTARKYGAVCVGGDITRSREVFLSITAAGYVKQGKAVLRSGAVPGQAIGVTGRLGGSLLRHHYAFEPRVMEGQFLARYASSMIDVSDGLAMDLGRLLEASGCGAAVEIERVPVSNDALRMARGNKSRALEKALSDGEDFELLFTVPKVRLQAFEKGWRKNFPGLVVTWIGHTVKGKPAVQWFLNGGRLLRPPIKKQGYDHFRSGK